MPWSTVVCDVTDDDAVAALGLVVRERFGGRLDALVNNAGIAMAGPWEELTPTELRRSLDVNLVGAMAVTGACLPALRAAQGVVVNISSVSGQAGDPLMGPYNASKFGLEGASEALRLELRPFGVRVAPRRARPVPHADLRGEPDRRGQGPRRRLRRALEGHRGLAVVARGSRAPTRSSASPRSSAPSRATTRRSASRSARASATSSASTRRPSAKQADAADAWLATL